MCVVCTAGAGLGTRLLAGCTTGAMAVTFAQPTDVVKVRFQAQVRLPESGSVKRYSGTMDAYRTIARDEGIKGLWKGKQGNKSMSFVIISVAVRVGILLQQVYKLECKMTHQFSHSVQCCSSLFPLCLKNSVLAAVSLKPLPLLNTQSPLIGQLTHTWPRTTNNNSSAEPNQDLHAKIDARRKLLQNIWHGGTVWCHKVEARQVKLYRSQRWTIFSGCLPNITRNAIVNCSELVTYDIIKELILKNDLMTGECKRFRLSPLHSHNLFIVPVFSRWSSMWLWITKTNILFGTDNMPCHFTAAFAAGFCTTIVASPVDVVKTRYMNSVPGQYSGAMNCAITMLLNEGTTAFYKGYVVYLFNADTWESMTE